jgi:hypothetical protein
MNYNNDLEKNKFSIIEYNELFYCMVHLFYLQENIQNRFITTVAASDVIRVSDHFMPEADSKAPACLRVSRSKGRIVAVCDFGPPVVLLLRI